MYKLSCLKCKEQYESNDPDPYYCETCLPEIKRIAQDVSKKIAMRPRKQVKSDFQRYEEALKASGGKFVNYKSL